LPDSFKVTKKSTPIYIEQTNEAGETITVPEHNTFFKASLLKRYYNKQLCQYFTDNNYLVKPNFVDDIEVWIPSIDKSSDNTYNYYDKFSLKLQIARITKQPEFLVSFEGTSRVFKQSVSELSKRVSPSSFTWVIYNTMLCRYKQLPESASSEYDKVFPMRNFDIRRELNQSVEAPERGNKYLKYKKKIEHFFSEHICTDGFQKVIPIDCDTYKRVEALNVQKVNAKSNLLKFGNKHQDISPINGMRHGPIDSSKHKNIHFFFICHADDIKRAEKINAYLGGAESGFKGIEKYINTLYYTEKNFSIIFKDRNNPLPEIRNVLKDKAFKEGVQYFAVYISPISKHTNDTVQRTVYYKVKELLLDYNIPSQALDYSKILNNKNYHYSLPNIAIAMLSKLNGTPWRLDTKLRNDLVIGVGAFKNLDTNVQYIGSAFSFQNNGKFNSFNCFRNNEINELAGSILNAVKEYAAHTNDLKRVIIHFYKNMKQKELEPIEKGLRELGLDVPVFIVSGSKLLFPL
jgi:hypothetical protein